MKNKDLLKLILCGIIGLCISIAIISRLGDTMYAYLVLMVILSGAIFADSKRMSSIPMMILGMTSIVIISEGIVLLNSVQIKMLYYIPLIIALFILMSIYVIIRTNIIANKDAQRKCLFFAFSGLLMLSVALIQRAFSTVNLISDLASMAGCILMCVYQDKYLKYTEVDR